MSELDDLDSSSEEDTFKILLATDIHLGYKEKHVIRDEDSFVAFEEILKIAVREDVDFILLGGDLFHDSKPSPYCLQKCSELIKQYCFGEKPVTIEFLSDQSYHFKHLKNPIVNYEDPNINVSIPIFSIHGNHDDPTGSKAISAMDLLAASGLLNYFGRWTDLKNVEVVPILLQKGNSKLALYGLSHIHDQRLARLFRDQKVTMVRPGNDDWFNLLVWHQNRANRGAKNFIPITSIPDFIDLVMWGHEHDCAIKPYRQNNSVWITQPGSSVATSLSEGESIPKHVGVLYVKNQDFKIKPIPLKTVRPFIFRALTLEDPAVLKRQDIFDLSKYSWKKVSDEIEGILKSISEERKRNKLKDILPLVKLVVRYHDEQQQFNAIRLSQNFVSRVANPEDLITQKSLTANKREGRNRFLDSNVDVTEMETEVDKLNYIKDIVDNAIDGENNKRMNIISKAGMGIAVGRYIDNDDADALSDIIRFQTETTIKQLQEMEANEGNINLKIDELYQRRVEINDGRDVDEMARILNNPNRRHKNVANNPPQADDDDDDVVIVEKRPTSGPGSRGGKVRGRGRGRGKK